MITPKKYEHEKGYWCLQYEMFDGLWTFQTIWQQAQDM